MSSIKISTGRIARFAALSVLVPLVGCGGADEISRTVSSDTVDAFIGPDCMDLIPPAVIEKSGCYRMVRNFSALADGDFGITITAPHVKLDLNGHTLTGSGPNSTAVGVHAIGVERITVENGTFRNFLYGIRIDPSTERSVLEATVRGVHVTQGTARGIYVAADIVTVEDTQVNNLSGYTGWPASHTMAIEVAASQHSIANNQVGDYLPEGVGEAVGISLSSPVDNCTVTNNTIDSSVAPEFGRTIGIWVASEQSGRDSDALLINRNSVTGADYGFFSRNTPRIEDNKFAVTCGPWNVTTYDSYVGHNDFVTHTRECTDTVEYLETLAGGDPRWKIRLAAALIERQSVNAEEEGACEDYTRAKAILFPLVEGRLAGAVEQAAWVDLLLNRWCT